MKFFCIAILNITLLFCISSSAQNNWKYYQTGNSPLPNNEVRKVLIENSSSFWFGTIAGLVHKQGNNWTTYDTTNSGLPSPFINDLALGSNNELWIATTLGGLAKLHNSTWTIYNPSNSSIPDITVNTIEVDKNNKIWLGTPNHGLASFDGQSWSIYNTSNSGMTSNTVKSIAIDSNNNIYIGTVFGGLTVFDGVNWQNFSTANSPLPQNTVTTINILDTVVWLGTDNGIAEINGQQWSIYNSSNSNIYEDCILDIAFDDLNRKWVGTYCGFGQGSLTMYDNSAWQYWNKQNSSYPSEWNYSVAIDQNGNKWMGTSNGVIVFNESGVVSNNDKRPSSTEVTVFPNPFNNQVTFTFTENNFNGSLQVYNTQGKLIEEIALTDRQSATIFLNDKAHICSYLLKDSSKNLLKTGLLIRID